MYVRVRSAEEMYYDTAAGRMHCRTVAGAPQQTGIAATLAL